MQGKYLGEVKKEELQNKIQTDVALASEKCKCNVPQVPTDNRAMRSKSHQYVKRKEGQQNSHHNWLLSKWYCKLGGAKEVIGLKALRVIWRV